MITDLSRVKQVISVLQTQRNLLGDTVVDTSLAALQQQLAELEQGPASTAKLSGERKQVTVMFADISGFTAMSEKLDPEEVRSMINACFERLGAAITRYDGHIDKFIGDAIMALFGAPIAHENDPERALRAALEMVDTLAEFNRENATRLPQPLRLHFGLNTGLVIAGGIGTSQRQDYSVMGDAVNLASRLEGLSEAGEILVGEDTYRLTTPLFEFEPRKPAKIKGKEQPVKFYRLVAAKKVNPGQIRGIEGLTSPLVGRQQEMARLKEVLGQLLDGRGGVISVIGEAGIGKSRLTQELYQMCQHQPRVAQTSWARGRALSYGENVSYLAARELLGHLLGLEPDNSPVEADLTLRHELEQLFGSQAARVYPYLAHLLEIPLRGEPVRQIKELAGEALQARLLQAAQDYLVIKAQQQPLVLVWEDLQWADPSSLALLESLLPSIRQSPVLLLLVYRPRRESRVWSLHQKISQLLPEAHTSIELPPLSLEESQELLRNLLGNCEIPEKSCQLLISKAEGNPFYIEEVIRSLIDRGLIVPAGNGQHWQVTAGIEAIQIPDTLQGVIMARIDRLPPELKRVLQVAAVIGRNFSYEVLAGVIGR